MKGNLDMENDITKVKNKIINLANGTADDDAVNLAQLKSYTDSHKNNYHLQPSFTFSKNFGDQAQLNVQSINIPNHDHHDLLIAGKEDSDPDLDGEAWLKLKMTNNLPSGTYTPIFETISATILSPSNITILNNETLIQQTYDDANYKIITFSHDYQTTHSKAFIQFTSNGRSGKITFQSRYFGSSYNNSSLYFLFYSRVVSGKVGTVFDHKIFDVDDVQLRDQILYFDDINMGENIIKGLADATEDSHASNKKYVGAEIAKLPKAETDVLKLNGSRPMKGNLDMDIHTITGIRSSPAYNAALTVGASKILYLPISGIRGMQRDLNMSKLFTIVNIKPFVENESAKPAQDNEVINFGYFSNQRTLLKTLINDTTISVLIDKKIEESENLNIQGNNEENVFSFVMDKDLFKEDDSDITT